MHKDLLRKLILLVLWVTSLSVSGIAVAENLSDNPIEISADSVNISDGGDEQVFQGGVVVVQGSFTLKGDLITVTQASDALKNMVVVGTPAILIDAGSQQRTAFNGSSSQITIDYTANQALMEGDVRIERENARLKAQLAHYDLDSGNVKVTGANQADSQSGSGRLRMIITN